MSFLDRIARRAVDPAAAGAPRPADVGLMTGYRPQRESATAPEDELPIGRGDASGQARRADGGAEDGPAEQGESGTAGPVQRAAAPVVTDTTEDPEAASEAQRQAVRRVGDAAPASADRKAGQETERVARQPADVPTTAEETPDDERLDARRRPDPAVAGAAGDGDQLSRKAVLDAPATPSGYGQAATALGDGAGERSAGPAPAPVGWPSQAAAPAQPGGLGAAAEASAAACAFDDAGPAADVASDRLAQGAYPQTADRPVLANLDQLLAAAHGAAGPADVARGGEAGRPQVVIEQLDVVVSEPPAQRPAQPRRPSSLRTRYLRTL